MKQDLTVLNENITKSTKYLKVIIVLLIAIFAVLVIGVSKMFDKGTNETDANVEETLADYDVSMFEEIEAKDIASKTKKSKQVVYVGRSTCSWCAQFLPTLQKAQEEYGYTTLYVDIAKIIDFNATEFKLLDEDAYNTMMALTGDEYSGYMSENFGATPMVLIIEKGKIIGAQTGYSEYETFEKVLTDAGFKK